MSKIGAMMAAEKAAAEAVRDEIIWLGARKVPGEYQRFEGVEMRAGQITVISPGPEPAGFVAERIHARATERLELAQRGSSLQWPAK